MSPATGAFGFPRQHGRRASIAADGGKSLLVQWVQNDLILSDVLIHLLIGKVSQYVNSQAIQAGINGQNRAHASPSTIRSTQAAD